MQQYFMHLVYLGTNEPFELSIEFIFPEVERVVGPYLPFTKNWGFTIQSLDVGIEYLWIVEHFRGNGLMYLLGVVQALGKFLCYVKLFGCERCLFQLLGVVDMECMFSID